jgi:hypothetical protein
MPLRDGQSVELLITRVNLPPGSPHGVSLAMMARRKIPDLKVLFIARPEQQEHTDGIGEFIPLLSYQARRQVPPREPPRITTAPTARECRRATALLLVLRERGRVSDT